MLDLFCVHLIPQQVRSRGRLCPSIRAALLGASVGLLFLQIVSFFFFFFVEFAVVAVLHALADHQGRQS